LQALTLKARVLQTKQSLALGVMAAVMGVTQRLVALKVLQGPQAQQVLLAHLAIMVTMVLMAQQGQQVALVQWGLQVIPALLALLVWTVLTVLLAPQAQEGLLAQRAL
jgi:hypothetical protein